MSSSIVSFIHHLNYARHYAEDAKRQQSSHEGNVFWKKYIDKIEWMFNDFKTYPRFSQEVRNGVQKEWDSDVFTVASINEKIALLNPEQREQIEAVLDKVLKKETETITININK